MQLQYLNNLIPEVDAWNCSVKKDFSQNLFNVTESLLLWSCKLEACNFTKKNFDTCVFLWVLRNFQYHLLYKAPPGGWFYHTNIAISESFLNLADNACYVLHVCLSWYLLDFKTAVSCKSISWFEKDDRIMLWKL